MEQTLKVEYDMRELFLGIKDAIKTEMGKDLADEIKTELKSEIRNELFMKIKNDIRENTYPVVQQMAKDIFDTEKVVIGGGWDEQPKEYTLQEYVIQQIKNTIANNTCARSGGYSKETFQEWFINKCVDPEIKRIIDKEITGIRNEVNLKVKKIFDSSTRDMLSDTVLNVLLANDTYQKIEKNIACIANR